MYFKSVGINLCVKNISNRTLTQILAPSWKFSSTRNGMDPQHNFKKNPVHFFRTFEDHFNDLADSACSNIDRVF